MFSKIKALRLHWCPNLLKSLGGRLDPVTLMSFSQIFPYGQYFVLISDAADPSRRLYNRPSRDCPHRKLFQFPGPKTVKQNEEMKQNAGGWNNWKERGINSINCVKNGRPWSKLSKWNALTFAYTIQKSLGRLLVWIRSSAQNDQSLLPAFFYLFHFRGLKNVKQNEEMKQNAVKQLAAGTVLGF